MDKEQIYYGELIPVTGGENIRIPTIVILSDDTEDPCGLPEKAEEILASCKDRVSMHPGYLAGSRLIREQNVAVLAAQICPVDSGCLKELTGCLNAAAVQYVDQAVASSFGLGGMLSQDDIHTQKQKEEGKTNDLAGI